MKKLKEINDQIIGKWELVNWETSHAIYEPDEDPLKNIKEWKTFKLDHLRTCPSNLIYSGINKNNANFILSKEIVLEFSGVTQKRNYEFNIFIGTEKSKKLNWKESTEPNYCDLIILMGEVYNYANLKILNLTESEMVLIERIDNSVSDTYFQKITLKRKLNKNKFLSRLKKWLKSDKSKKIYS